MQLLSCFLATICCSSHVSQNINTSIYPTVETLSGIVIYTYTQCFIYVCVYIHVCVRVYIYAYTHTHTHPGCPNKMSLKDRNISVYKFRNICSLTESHETTLLSLQTRFSLLKNLLGKHGNPLSHHELSTLAR